MSYLRGTLEERLLNKRIVTDTGCWEFDGSRSKDGYGTIGRGGAGNKYGTVKAHRAAWEIWRGPIPEGIQVLHRCNNPPCFNPDDLYLGTDADNVAYREMCGRGADHKGSASNWAILDENRVRVIRRRYRNEDLSQTDLAYIYGVSQSCIWNIVRGKTWRHVQ